MGGRLSFGSKIDYPSVTVTATGVAEPGFAATNVQNPRLDKTWRAPAGAATRVLTIDYGLGVTFTVWFVMVIGHVRRPINGNVTIRLISNVGATLATATVAPGAYGALDRRIFGLGDAGLAGVRKVEIEIPAGSEIARVAVDFGSSVDGFADTTNFASDWAIEPAEPFARQLGIAAASFFSTSRPNGSAFVKPVRKRRMRFGLIGTTHLPYVLRYLRLVDIDELAVIIRFVDSRVATTAQIQEMHTTALYGRCAPPSVSQAAISSEGGPYLDRWNIRFEVEERA